MADAAALPLQSLIASLEKQCLPRILQVVSGVYFQGSVYELSGSEVCFSTGDLIKVVGIELQSVSCEDVGSEDKFELPINYTGRFTVVPEKMPYGSVEELLSLRPVGLDSSLPFTFTSSSKMDFNNFTLGSGRPLTILSIEHQEGQDDLVRCHVSVREGTSAEVRIPLSFRGEFYECESQDSFSLQEIMSSASLCCRRFHFSNAATKIGQSFVFSPIYKVQAIMNLRNGVLTFPSSLEMDVIDVTSLYKDMSFLRPLSLTDVLSRPAESFPCVVEILEEPHVHSLFRCSWFLELSKRERLIFHRVETTPMVLLSTAKFRKAQQYFLLSHQYGGRFRRQPREFSCVYELFVASSQAPGLKVSVTRNCEEFEEEGLPALSVGEQLEVVRCVRMDLPKDGGQGQKRSVDALLCHRVQELDDGDDDDDDSDEKEEETKHEDVREEVLLLPLYMRGQFVEVLSDTKKYRLRNLSKDFSVPLNVKVVSRDTELRSDPLAGLPCLRTEGSLLEPTIQASFLHTPTQCFLIPAKWFSMSLTVTEDPLPWSGPQPPECHMESVIEVTDIFFNEFCKRRYSDVAPPPVPPRKHCPPVARGHRSHHEPDSDRAPTKELSSLTLTVAKKRSPPPPPTDQLLMPAVQKHLVAGQKTGGALPNTYVKMNDSTKKGSVTGVTADVDSDHDYEVVDESLLKFLKSAEESAVFL